MPLARFETGDVLEAKNINLVRFTPRIFQQTLPQGRHSNVLKARENSQLYGSDG